MSDRSVHTIGCTTTVDAESLRANSHIPPGFDIVVPAYGAKITESPLAIWGCT